MAEQLNTRGQSLVCKSCCYRRYGSQSHVQMDSTSNHYFSWIQRQINSNDLLYFVLFRVFFLYMTFFARFFPPFFSFPKLCCKNWSQHSIVKKENCDQFTLRANGKFIVWIENGSTFICTNSILIEITAKQNWITWKLSKSDMRRMR